MEQIIWPSGHSDESIPNKFCVPISLSLSLATSSSRYNSARSSLTSLLLQPDSLAVYLKPTRTYHYLLTLFANVNSSSNALSLQFPSSSVSQSLSIFLQLLFLTAKVPCFLLALKRAHWYE